METCGNGGRPALVLVASLLAAPGALGGEPLYVKNLSPVAGLFGLPAQRGAFTTPAGGFHAAWLSAVASHFVNDQSASEFARFDGETLRFALELRYGIADDWDVQVEVPWLDHSGGELDRLVDGWHDFWGLPDGGRSDVPRNLLDFRYITAEGEVGLEDGASGIGDITVSVNHTFYRREEAAAALSLGYKLASGDAADFTGSGAGDVFLALRLSGDHLSELPLEWHGQMGYLRAGDSDLFERDQRRHLWFAGIAMDWRFARNWSAIIQVDSHRGPLDSNLTATGEDAFLLAVGGRWRFASRWQLDISVVEDIRVESAPDVTFQASLRRVPRH